MNRQPLHIGIKTPGNGPTVSLTVNDAEAALVGRSPDPSRSFGSNVDTVSPTHVVPLGSPSVSGNHVWIRNEDGRARIVDTGSRNGTWLKLPPNVEVTLAIPDAPMALHLAPPRDGEELDDVPEARWSDAHDYATGLTEAIAAWLGRRDLRARIAVIDSAAARVDGVGRLPLATGADLLVEPLHTVGAGWLEALRRVERFVAQQNVLFETEATMREDGLIVASAAMRAAISRIVDAATSGARALLLTGPSGSGKEGLARCFHRHLRRPGPFVARNCAMFSKELVRSELFGAEKGAFTGSIQRIVGAVEAANEGTLFLDELGELPRDVQPMLLRFLDHGEYERLGRYGHPSKADVRLVCATNRDLRAASLKDEFRTDLWFRLSVHVVEVPPLRERFEDISAYLKGEHLPSGQSLFEALPPPTMALLAAHEWEGNFRELISFAERLKRIAVRGAISAEAARQALAEGALHPLKTPTTPTTAPVHASATARASERAFAAFAADRGVVSPRTWDEVKDFIENYLKPVMFAELSTTANATNLDDVDLRASAERVGSDRGTASKQLRRYFDRFLERERI